MDRELGQTEGKFMGTGKNVGWKWVLSFSLRDSTAFSHVQTELGKSSLILCCSNEETWERRGEHFRSVCYLEGCDILENRDSKNTLQANDTENQK